MADERGGDDRDAVAVAVADLLAANKILSNEGVIDAFGHVSCRHPERSDHFIMSRARAPALVTAEDLMEFDAAGGAIDPSIGRPYVERYIHAAIYEARPDVRAVVHDHSTEVIPYTVSTVPLRPVSHIGGLIGEAVPVWDIGERFASDSNLLVVNMEMGRDLARRLGAGSVVLMRGHGVAAAAASIRVAVIAAIMVNLQARLGRQAIALGGDVTYLSAGEVAATTRTFTPADPGDSTNRTWEYWCARAGVPFHKNGA